MRYLTIIIDYIFQTNDQSGIYFQGQLTYLKIINQSESFCFQHQKSKQFVEGHFIQQFANNVLFVYVFFFYELVIKV